MIAVSVLFFVIVAVSILYVVWVVFYRYLFAEKEHRCCYEKTEMDNAVFQEINKRLQEEADGKIRKF